MHLFHQVIQIKMLITVIISEIVLVLIVASNACLLSFWLVRIALFCRRLLHLMVLFVFVDFVNSVDIGA